MGRETTEVKSNNPTDNRRRIAPNKPTTICVGQIRQPIQNVITIYLDRLLDNLAIPCWRAPWNHRYTIVWKYQTYKNELTHFGDISNIIP